MSEDGSISIPLIVSDIETNVGDMEYTIISSEALLFTTLEVVTDNENATINIVGSSNAYGIADVSVGVNDGLESRKRERKNFWKRKAKFKSYELANLLT